MPTCITFNSTVDFTVTALSAPQDGYNIAIAQATPSPTATPVPTPTPSPTLTVGPTPSPSATPASTPLPTASATPVPTASPTGTPVPTASTTPVPTPSNTPVPTASATPVPTASATPVPTSTPAPSASATPVPTPSPTPVILTISPTTLPNPTVGVAYSETVTASLGTSPYTYSVTIGSLPAGLSLNSSTGVISGTPTASGSVSFTITASDSASPTGIGNRPYTVNVQAGGGSTPITGSNDCFSPTAWPAYGSGNKYSINLSATAQNFQVDSQTREIYIDSGTNLIRIVRYQDDDCFSIVNSGYTTWPSGISVSDGGLKNNTLFALRTASGTQGPYDIWIV